MSDVVTIAQYCAWVRAGVLTRDGMTPSQYWDYITEAEHKHYIRMVTEGQALEEYHVRNQREE